MAESQVVEAQRAPDVSPVLPVTEAEVLDISSRIRALQAEDPFIEKGTVKVFLAEPSQGQVDIICEDNRKDFYMELGLVRQCSRFRFFSGSTGRMLISFARDMFADEAVKLGMDWLLMFDDDMVLPRKMFLAMMRNAEDADIVVPLAFQRVPPYKPVIYDIHRWEEDGKLMIKTEHKLDYPINKTFPIDAAGAGVMLIRTSFLQKIPKPWFFSNTSLGEDIYFCVRAKQAGARIVCDSRIKVGHLGYPNLITEWDFIKANKEALKEIRKGELELVDAGIPALTTGL